MSKDKSAKRLNKKTKKTKFQKAKFTLLPKGAEIISSNVAINRSGFVVPSQQKDFVRIHEFNSTYISQSFYGMRSSVNKITQKDQVGGT